jgi:hypothetical protein
MVAAPPSDLPPARVGAHLLEQEAADLLMVRMHGDISAEEARQLILIDRQQARRNGYSLMLIDCTHMAPVSSSVRKSSFEELKRHHGYIGTTALFGATGAVAWMLKLMLRGFALLATHVDDEVQMFSTEAQARAFLARRRPQRQLEVGTRSSS